MSVRLTGATRVPAATSPLLARAAAFVQLTKPAITRMVLLTTGAGFALAAPWSLDLAVLLHTLIGTGLAAGGTNALNQVWERDADARMLRTRERPLPSGSLGTAEALAFALVISMAGIAYLLLLVGLMPALLVAATLMLYLLVYTPLKRRTHWCTEVGAVSGALPVLVGWVAGGGRLDAGGLSLFAILFLWQLPHFYALAWIHREDYRRGGFRVLGIEDGRGAGIGPRGLFYAVLLVPVSVVPWWLGLAGPLVLPAVLGLGAMYVGAAARMAARPGLAAATALFRASIIYLPVILAALVMAGQAAR